MANASKGKALKARLIRGRKKRNSRAKTTPRRAKNTA